MRAQVLAVTCSLALLVTAAAEGQPTDSREPTYRFENGTLSAIPADGQGQGWRLELLTADRLETFGRAGQGPVRVGDAVYLCLDTSLFEVAAEAGTVRRRLRLPGACRSLQAAGGRVEVTASGDGPPPWQASYRVGPGSGRIPFFAFPEGNPGLGLFERMQAERLAVPGDDPQERRAFLQEPARRGELEAAVVALAALAERDPTNPWYDYFRGEYLDALDRPEEAAAAFRATLDSDPQADYSLVPLAARLERFDPELAATAWRRGMRFLLEHGYQPELSLSLLGVMVTLGRPGRDELDPGREPDRDLLELRAERLADLAPRAEGSAGFYLAMQRAAERFGDAAGAARFQRLFDQARGYELLAPMAPEARHLGFGINALLALLLGLGLAGGIKTLRTFSADFEAPVSVLLRYNPLGRWSRPELVGLLAGFGLGLWLAVRVLSGVIEIGVVSQMPTQLVLGNLSHPAALAYLDDLQQPGGGAPPAGARFLQALGLQQAGRLEQAAALYEGLDLPRAKVNLGLVRQAQGDEPAARRLWEQAAEADPHLAVAAWNLGRQVDSLRIAHARRYGLQGPLLAMPTVDIWADLWRAKAAQRPELARLDPVGALLALAAESADMGFGLGSQAWTALTWLLLVAVVLAAVALLAGVRRPRLGPPRRGLWGWSLGLALPGASRQYWALWPLVTVGFVFTLLGAWVLLQTGGASSNAIDAIAGPALGRYYGATAEVTDPLGRFLDGLCSWPVILGLLGAHGLFLWLAERLRPDPAGPFYPRQPAAGRAAPKGGTR